MRPGRALLAAAALAAAPGCAGAPVRPAGAVSYRFPRAFEGSQVVTILGAGERREMIASVRRAGDDYEVTLFDPVLQVPLLAARARAGVVTEELLTPGPRPGDGKRLVELLREVYGQEYGESDGAALAQGRSGRARLTGLPPGGGPCRFPREIEIAPRTGAVRVAVRTTDLACPAGGAAGPAAQ
ncbi:MAG TPA: hypothetical protein VMU15_01890 [Anaeromyxobacter sp.]|nr:hypothetical protein [Anaeromyxobacter sp.]